MVYREASDGMQQVTSEKELSTLLDMGCNVYSRGTGPFGEDQGAKVVGFGKVKDYHNKLKGIKWVADEEGYDSEEEWLADNADTNVVVLDKLIGQEPCNWYALDAYTVEDLDLWARASEVEMYFLGKDSSGKSKKACPKCGGEVLHYVKLPKPVMGREEFEACTQCGTMIPLHS